MYDIVFVNLLYDTPVSGNASANLPTGILSLATILKKNQYKVKIIDFNYIYKHKILNYVKSVDENIEEMTEYITSFKSKIVSFYTMCNSYHESLMIAKAIKEKKSNIKILFGGPHASLTAKKSMERFEWIDYIGIGEGEKNILQIVDTILNNGCFENIKGFSYRDKKSVKCNFEQNLINNLDELPLLDFSFLDMKALDAIPVEIGRGCPFGCTYCSTKTFWKRKFRIKSPERIMEELKIAVNDYGIKKFMFTHDIFTANKNQVIAICNKIIEENLKIQWSCHSRIDTLDKEILEKLARAGCKGIFFGVETGSQRMQKMINKNLKLDKVYEVMDLLKKYNMQIIASFIYGFPEETVNDVRKTLEMIINLRKMKISHVQLFSLAILPGTEIFDKYKGELQISQDVSDISSSYSVKRFYDSLIKDNIDIFPQYFKFNSPTREKLDYLDLFVNNVLPIMDKYFSCTYEKLMVYYTNDILNLFFDFKNVNLHKLMRMRDDKLLYDNITEKLSMIEKYIFTMDDYLEDKTVKEIFKFELDIFKFMYLEEKDEKIVQYKYNVYDMKRHITHNPYNDLKNTVIKFQRKNNKQIRISCV